MPKKNILTLSMTLLTALFATLVFANDTRAEELPAERKAGKFGVIKGVVRDKSGKPIAKATVAIFRVGTSKLLKQVTATKSGRFFAKIMPGTYTVLAVAQGFNPVTLKKVQVKRAAKLNYGFKLERAGRGNTLPEKRTDRNSARTAIRAARRSIYQNQEGEKPPIEQDNVARKTVGENADTDETSDSRKNSRKGQTVVETFVASNGKGTFGGVNFATLKPVNEKTEVIFAGQTGTGRNAPQRFETSVNFRPNDNHQLQVKGAIANIGDIEIANQTESLGQISLQALDQWKVREGVVVVLGVDYSRFIGAGDDYSISPRIGFQYDLDYRTRVRTAYTTQNEPRTWRKVIELENSQVLFREPVVSEEVVVLDDKPQMNKSTRFEFGIERVLDNRSTIEANAFFDTVVGRGVGLVSMPLDSLNGDAFSDIVGNQQGKTQGVRVVYNRRFGSIFSASTGFAYGSGQKLSEEAISNPSNIFQNDIFQTIFGQVNTDLKTGTSIKTIFRFSPQATVFAIDPFQGRLAIYDPGLNVMVTQNLPSWGLPIDAEATLDARNIFDFQNGVSDEKSSLFFSSHRRILRGGILVRF